MSAAPKLLLIDGLSLAFRAFYALPTDLATPNGTVTNAVYGFTSMLVKVLTDERPDAIAVVFDAPGRTFRDDLDAEYKAGRKETPDLFVPQLPLIHEVIDALQIPTLEVEGVEADDVIATLATRAAESGTDVIIVTGDRDAYQLVRGPARQGPLQPTRRVRLRAVRRGRDHRAYGRHRAAVPRVRGAPRRPERQPPGRPRRRREDGGEARVDLRDARRDLRAPRRASPEAAAEPRRRS